MPAVLLFAYGLIALLLTLNALRGPRPPTHRLPPIWLFGMITSEAARAWLALVMGVGALSLWGGLHRSRVGGAGLVLTGLAALGLVVVVARSRRAVGRLAPPVAIPTSPLDRLISWPYRLPPDVERTEVAFAPHPHRSEALSLDLYRSRRRAAAGLPTVVYVHGGSWTGGSRRASSRVLIHHLARSGWAVAAIDYPLSPRATFPDHLLGIEAALAWLRDEGRPLGLDGRVVLAGSSSGAHLAAVAALGGAAVEAAVLFYGVYDFFNRHRTRHDWPLIPRAVMKSSSQSNPDAYRRASPIDLGHPGAPPLLVVHGTFDSLVPPDEARYFVGAVREAGGDVDHLEVAHAQHAFDAAAGPRARAVAAVAERWLAERVAFGAPEHEVGR